MGQTWERLAFLHWPVPADALAGVLPAGVEPDEFDGSAWIGMTPFEIHSLRLRRMPPLPLLSTFPELNVRTYVTHDGKPGIWFMSLDAASRPAVFAARRVYRLPYHHARIEVRERGGWVDYACARDGGEARFVARYRPIGAAREAEPGSFEHFAAERYCLYTVDERLTLLRADIHHEPWPVQDAEIEVTANTMARPYGFALAESPAHVHYARRLDVVIWSLERADL
jgi:uncharacterized protein